MKENYIKLIKDFSKITISSICDELHVSKSNVLNGRASENVYLKVCIRLLLEINVLLYRYNNKKDNIIND